VPANFRSQIPLVNEVIIESADAAFASQQTLPCGLDVTRDRSRRGDRSNDDTRKIPLAVEGRFTLRAPRGDLRLLGGWLPSVRGC